MEEAVTKIKKKFEWIPKSSDNEKEQLFNDLVTAYPHIKKILNALTKTDVSYTNIYTCKYNDNLNSYTLLIDKVSFNHPGNISINDLLDTYNVKIEITPETWFNIRVTIDVPNTTNMNNNNINEFDDNKEQSGRKAVLTGGNPNDILRRRLKYALLKFIKDNPKKYDPDPNAYDRITSSDLTMYEEDGGGESFDNGDDDDNNDDSNNDNRLYGNMISLLQMYKTIKNKSKNKSKNVKKL